MDFLRRIRIWFKRKQRARREGRVTAHIRIDNLTQPQLKAIHALMHQWQSLGNLGASRWTAFFADGDGNFRPRITVNGKQPQHSDKGRWETVTWKDGYPDEMYVIDFDWIAWEKHAPPPQHAPFL